MRLQLRACHAWEFATRLLTYTTRKRHLRVVMVLLSNTPAAVATLGTMQLRRTALLLQRACLHLPAHNDQAYKYACAAVVTMMHNNDVLLQINDDAVPMPQ